MGAEALYSPRRPEGTVLYRVVRDRLATFLASAEERYERPLPRYVENELRGYLKCGIFSYGFVRCHCDACGKDMLVAFSCKNRGVCPSCAARRMCNGAAHLVDRVLPNVPVRQWVVSLPPRASGQARPGLRALPVASGRHADVPFEHAVKVRARTEAGKLPDRVDR
jgi:hypothetical protein